MFLGAQACTSNGELAMDACLASWHEVASAQEWEGLLLGNGPSQAVWAGFAYNSLFEEASNLELTHFLSALDRRLFERMSTTNFETVLQELHISQVTARILGQPTEPYSTRYASIRNALVAAITNIHVRWVDLNDSGAREKICKALRSFKYVFSTNYDLILYWSMM